MADRIHMSLDDIIKRSSANLPPRRHSVHGPDRRFSLRSPVRTTPYSIPQARQQVWRRSIFPETTAAAPDITRTKLYISNLDYGVSNQDIKLLFSEEGELERYAVHYDKSGRSKGTAEVVFMRHSDALAAVKKYNNMRLDGKPLQIELVGTSLVTPAVMPPYQKGLLGRPPNGVFVSDGGSRFHNSFTRGHLPRGRGEEKNHIPRVPFRDLYHDLERYNRCPRGRIEGRGHIRKVSAKDLDEDLERYRLEAMKINKEN